MLLGESPEAGFQLFTACQRPALLRDSSADLAVARPAVEVSVHVGRLHLRYRPLHPYLPLKGLPVETKRRLGIGLELRPFPAFGIGEETEAALVRAFHQHHADAGPTRQGRGGQGGSVGVVGLAPLRLLKPQTEEFKGITILLRVGVVHISMVASMVVTLPTRMKCHGS